LDGRRRLINIRLACHVDRRKRGGEHGYAYDKPEALSYRTPVIQKLEAFLGVGLTISGIAARSGNDLRFERTFEVHDRLDMLLHDFSTFFHLALEILRNSVKDRRQSVGKRPADAVHYALYTVLADGDDVIGFQIRV